MSVKDEAKNLDFINQNEIRTRYDYEDALSELAPFLMKPPKQGTPAAILFYILVERTAAYEGKRFSLKNNLGMMSVH